jgi:hypothetical protein
MSDYINGCRNVSECPGDPTYIYRPEGGFPVAYCMSCLPHFLHRKVNSLEKTAHHRRLADETLQALEPVHDTEFAPVIAEVSEPPVPDDVEQASPAVVPEVVEEPAPAAPKTAAKRRPRKKAAPKTAVDE